jgi:hypothetical protein
LPAPCSTSGRVEPRPCHGFLTELVVRCGEGDDVAMASIYELFHPLVSSVAVSEVPHADVTQVVLDAFTRVWRRAGAFRPAVDGALAWLLGELSLAVAEHRERGPQLTG